MDGEERDISVSDGCGGGGCVTTALMTPFTVARGEPTGSQWGVYA